MSEQPKHPAHKIELNLREVGQLFNTLDPAPFPDKDLDGDAEEFILSWVREFPLDEPVALVVHLAELPAGENKLEARAGGTSDAITWNCTPDASPHLGPIDPPAKPKKKKK